MNTPATVNRPIRQAFGRRDGRTRSVVSDMPRKSPVIMIITINMGVKMAFPVMTNATARNKTCTTFLVIEFNVYVMIRWNMTRPSLTDATIPPRPGSISTIPAADLATSVAVDTAIPICA